MINTNDIISLELHKICCHKLKKNNSLLNIIKDNQKRFNEIHDNLKGVKLWNDIINTNNINYIIKKCLEKTPNGQILRSSSPFTNIIPFDEVLELKKKLRTKYENRTIN